MPGEGPHRIDVMITGDRGELVKRSPEQLAAEAERIDGQSIEERLRVLGIKLTSKNTLADGSAVFVRVRGERVHVLGFPYKHNKSVLSVKRKGGKPFNISLFSENLSQDTGE